MIAGIVGVPERAAQISELVDMLSPTVDRVKLFLDHDHRGTWWNQARTIREMTAAARPGEPVLITTDDAVTFPQWRRHWEMINAKARNRIYTMFSRQRFLFKPENLKRGYVTKCQERGFYDVAMIFIDYPDLIDRVEDWFESGGRVHPKVIKRQTHLDVVIQEYLITHNIPWTITIPTLFDHRTIKSSLGHNIGLSPFYLGKTHYESTVSQRITKK